MYNSKSEYAIHVCHIQTPISLLGRTWKKASLSEGVQEANLFPGR